MLFDGIGKKIYKKHLTRRKLTILALFVFGFLVFADYATLSEVELDVLGKGGGLQETEVESQYSIDENGSVTEFDEVQEDEGSTNTGETYVNEYENGYIGVTKVEE